MILKKRLFFPLTQIIIAMLTLVTYTPFACANKAVPHEEKIQPAQTSTPSKQATPHAQNATQQIATQQNATQQNATQQNATQQIATPAPVTQKELQRENNNKLPTTALQKQSATNTKEHKAAESLPKGWVQVESGLPPMYAGINGGTIALNVVHSNDGEVFALAGQKGNDFVTILQGNSTPQKTPKIAHNKTNENKNLQKVSAEKASTPLVKKTTETIIASSQLASNLAAAQTELLPFGLADNAMTNELFLSQNTPDPVLLALPKLTLGNYKSILGLPQRP